jgi:hypothetical protein
MRKAMIKAYRYVQEQPRVVSFARIVCADFEAFGALRKMAEPDLKEFLSKPRDLSNEIPIEVDKVHPRRRPGTIWLYGLLGVPEVVLSTV